MSLLSIEELNHNDILALVALLHGDGVEFSLEEIDTTLKFYKDFKFEKEFITAEESIERCLENTGEAREGFDSFWDYHLWYLGQTEEDYYKGQGCVEDHGDSIFPLIIDSSTQSDEWLLDGWHRYHAYIKYYPERKIPVLELFRDKNSSVECW